MPLSELLLYSRRDQDGLPILSEQQMKEVEFMRQLVSAKYADNRNSKNILTEETQTFGEA